MTRRLLWIYHRTSKIRQAVLEVIPEMGLRKTLEIRYVYTSYRLVCRVEHGGRHTANQLYHLGFFLTVADAKAEADRYQRKEKELDEKQLIRLFP